MAEAMKGVTKAMGRMNKNMKLPQIQKIMQGTFLLTTLSRKLFLTEYNYKKAPAGQGASFL